MSIQPDQVTISADHLRALLSAAGSHFNLACRALSTGITTISFQEDLAHLRDLQAAIEEAIDILQFERTPSLESMLQLQSALLTKLERTHFLEKQEHHHEP